MMPININVIIASARIFAIQGSAKNGDINSIISVVKDAKGHN